MTGSSHVVCVPGEVGNHTNTRTQRLLGPVIPCGLSLRLTPRVTAEELKEAMEDPDVLTVALHKPGSRVTTKDGKVYVVTEDGDFREQTEDEKNLEKLRRVYGDSAEGDPMTRSIRKMLDREKGR